MSSTLNADADETVEMNGVTVPATLGNAYINRDWTTNANDETAYDTVAQFMYDWRECTEEYDDVPEAYTKSVTLTIKTDGTYIVETEASWITNRNGTRDFEPLGRWEYDAAGWANRRLAQECGADVDGKTFAQ